MSFFFKLKKIVILNEYNNNEEKNLESSPRRSLWYENKLFEILISMLQIVKTLS